VAWLSVTKDHTGTIIDRKDKTQILLNFVRFGQMQLKVTATACYYITPFIQPFAAILAPLIME
jgi:hypothetical protein